MPRRSNTSELTPYYSDEQAALYQGDCLAVLGALAPASFDAVVTDPPAGIDFMGKDWDAYTRADFVAFMTRVMAGCYAALKPGGHALVWALPRTSHWTATAIEDAGFEVRDVVTHHFGTGFPKSLDVSKALDEAAGAERAELRQTVEVAPTLFTEGGQQEIAVTQAWKSNNAKNEVYGKFNHASEFLPVTEPATEAAKRWQGWGTRLKPASEHWIMARKPMSEGTVAANVLKHGTGAINVDACRIGTDVVGWGGVGTAGYEGGWTNDGEARPVVGRWPANLILSHSPGCVPPACLADCPVTELDRQSGETISPVAGERSPDIASDSATWRSFGREGGLRVGYGDRGGASRFFYVPKATTAERNEGLEDCEPEQRSEIGPGDPDASTLQTRLHGSRPSHNVHPTVKPLDLMRYLCRLITPAGGLVLDPFAGSGSTGIACVLEGFRFAGIERETTYLEIAAARLRHWAARPQQKELAL